MEVYLLICALLLVIYVYRVLIKSSASQGVPVPGLKPENTTTGNLDEMKSLGSMHQFLEKYHRQYGPIFSFWYGPKMCISIASASLFQEHGAYFDRPQELFQFAVPLISSSSIQLTNGEAGRKRHATYSKAFNPSGVKRFHIVFNNLGRELAEKWLNVPKDEQILVQDEMFQVAIRSILQTMCGEEFENNKLVKDIKASYDFCWAETEKNMVGDVFIPGSAREVKFQAEKQTMYDLIVRAIVSRRQLSDSEKERLPIDAILELNLTESEVVSDLLTLLIAGFHTSATLLVWSVYFLASHQEIQDKVREEVLRFLGSCEFVTDKMVDQLVYLKQVLKETLRISCLGPVAARIHHSDIFLGKYKVPAEIPVIHALGVSLYDETVFPEPQKFDPDRFSLENEKKLPPFSFEPFGFGGKRKCPGYNFSFAEATVILALLLRSIRIELVPGQVVEPLFGFVTKIKDDLWVIAKPL